MKQTKNYSMCFNSVFLTDFKACYETGEVETHSQEEDPPYDAPYFGGEPLSDENLSKK